MAAQRIQVFEYVTEEGRCPFRGWLRSLKDRQARTRIRARINRIRAGNLGDWKSVGGGVLELRVSHGPGYRVYFGRRGTALVLLLCGGDKRTQSRDIRTAQQHWADYQRRQS